MAHPNVLYSPYGAFELKAKYQRNFLLGTIATFTFVALILITAWLISVIRGGDLEAIDMSSTVIKTVADLGPPPSVAKKPPQVQVSQPNVAAPKVGIPKPVADEEVQDEDVVLATREELAEIVAPDITASGSGDNIVVDISDQDYLPAPDEFVPVEIQPEMVYYETPEYPRLAKQAGEHVSRRRHDFRRRQAIQNDAPVKFKNRHNIFRAGFGSKGDHSHGSSSSHEMI